MARLALVIAEYQCDVEHRSQNEALEEFLPLATDNWITHGNALLLNWEEVCPPVGNTQPDTTSELRMVAEPQLAVSFENEGGEVFICGNPPYFGSQWQTPDQKVEMSMAFDGLSNNYKSLDYVTGWFAKAAKYIQNSAMRAAFVATNSVSQGRQVSTLWGAISRYPLKRLFAFQSFKWSNLASHNAGVTVVIVGIGHTSDKRQPVVFIKDENELVAKEVDSINPYLLPGEVWPSNRRAVQFFSLMKCRLEICLTTEVFCLLTTFTQSTRGSPRSLCVRFGGQRNLYPTSHVTAFGYTTVSWRGLMKLNRCVKFSQT